MEIDPRRLGVLLAVSRQNSVVGAASSLRVSPSAVSQQIARLEHETQVTLLDRNPGGVTLTPAGRVLAEAAEQIEAELHRAERALLEVGGEVTGTVRVGSFHSVIRSLLLPLLGELDERLPGVDLVVHEVVADDAMPALRSGDLDLLILERDATVRATSPRGTDDVPILDEPWYLLTPSSLPEPRSLSDMAHRSWLDVDADTASGRAMRRLTAGLGVDRAPHRALDHTSTILMVAAGLGSALLPALALVDNLPEGVAAHRLPGLGSRRLVARHRSTRGEPTEAVRYVIDALIDRSALLAEGFDTSLDAGTPTP